MPQKPLTPCRYPNCPELTDGRYCPKHQKLIRQEYDRFHRDPAHRKRYHTSDWLRIRAAQLARQPLCEACLQTGRYEKATLVHHRLPLAEGGTNHPDNLCSLCASCHSKLHARQ